MKKRALRRGLPVLLLVGMFVILVIAANSVAEAYRLLSPLNTSGFPAYSTSSSVTFALNLTIDTGLVGNITNNNISNWSLYFGEVGSIALNDTNSTSWSNSTDSFTLENVNDGTYEWNVGLTINTSSDAVTYFLNESNVTLVVDTISPNVSVVVPSAGNYSGNLLINASTNDSMSGVNITQYRFESPGYNSLWLELPSYGSFYNATNISTSLPDRRYNLSINATDNAGNQNVSLNITQITIDNQVPSVAGVFVNLTATSAGDVVANTGLLTVNATIIDNGTGVLNATFRYENSTENGNWTQLSRFGTSDYYLGTIDLADFVEGLYNFTINATDYMAFENSTVKYIGLTVDRTPPSTSATIGPINDSDLDGNVEMSWTDDTAEPNATYIILRSTANITNLTVANTNLTTYSRIASGVQSFEDNTTTADNATAYWYAIMTVDSVGNANFTANNTFIGVFTTSTTANDTIKPKIPMGLDCSASSSSTARLRWLSVYQDVAGNADTSTYKVYRNTTNISYDISVINLSYGGSGFALLSSPSSNSTTNSVTVTGSYHYIVTSLDDRSNENLTVNTSNYCNVSLTYTAPDDDEPAGGGTSSGTTGGGAAALTTGVKVSHIWTVLGTGTTTMKISKTGIYFTELAFTTSKGANQVEVAVQALSSKPSSVNSVASAREVYQYIQVDKTNLPDSYVYKVMITFKIEKKKLLDAEASAGSVVLMRYNETGKKWADLTTSLLDISDPIYYHYQAVSPGLSVFAIASRSADEEEAATIETLNVSAEGVNETVGNATGSAETTAPAKSNTKLYVIILVTVLVAAGLGVGGYFLYKRNGGFGGFGGFFGRFRGLKVSKRPTMKMPAYQQ